MKICCLCEIEKELTEFYKRKGRKDGLYERCKQCSKITREMVIDYEAGKVFWKYSNRMLKEIGCNSNGYLNIRIDKKKISIHRLIYETFHNIKLKPDDIIDHIDRNTLNNRINNLRLVTKQQNAQNQTLKPNRITTSKYKGVSFNKQHKKWQTYINYNKKRIHLGYFDNEEDATRAYNKKAEELNRQGCCYSLNEF